MSIPLPVKVRKPAIEPPSDERSLAIVLNCRLGLVFDGTAMNGAVRSADGDASTAVLMPLMPTITRTSARTPCRPPASDVTPPPKTPTALPPRSAKRMTTVSLSLTG